MKQLRKLDLEEERRKTPPKSPKKQKRSKTTNVKNRDVAMFSHEKLAE